MKTWRDYSASSLRDFLKHHTDGDLGHGGSRYECSECGAEYYDLFGVRRCWQYYHGDNGLQVGEFDPEKHAIEIRFDENGEEIN